MEKNQISGNQISDKKLWPYIEGRKVLKRENFSPEYIYKFETGFGPSGFPHIGTFGEVVRTDFIINALKKVGFKTELIVFSDDLDGLRKVPEGMPKWLNEHLGKPVSSIPDPFGDRSSFSDYMNSRLKDMLKWMNIDYRFESSKECYQSGKFNDAIKILLKNYDELEKIITPTLSKETLKNWHPFFPICEKCGNVLTTSVNRIDLQEYTVDYSCNKKHGELNGCGYKGIQSALNGRGKMTWRVDWPMRWYTLGIDYELYGKDLIESFNVGRQIMRRIFKTTEPDNMFYEMFLDENGAKISKSKGKGLTVEQWLKYGSVESLYLLMYRKPRKAKELSLNIIPSYVDDVISIGSDFHSKSNLKEHEFDFITQFKSKDTVFPNISYKLICNLMTAIKSSDKNLIKSYISKQKELTTEQINSLFLDNIIEKAEKYYSDFLANKTYDTDFSEKDIFLINKFVESLNNDLSADEIHNSVYSIARTNNIQPKNLFKVIYLALIGQERGPRLGSFVKMIGQNKTAEIITESLNTTRLKS